MQVDYDALYIDLGLKPGASLSEIQKAWKAQAELAYSYNYPEGSLRDKAEKRSYVLNNARDVLKDYWEKNNAPPPSKFQAHSSSGAVPPEPTWQEEAYKNWQKERQQEKNREDNARRNSRSSPPPHPEPPQAKSAKSLSPLGPPPLRKGLTHHIYDLVDQLSASDEFKQCAFIVVVIALCTCVFSVVAFVLNALGSIFGIPGAFWMNQGAIVTLALLIAIAVPAFRWIRADCDLYEILVNPYLKPSIMSVQDALNTITKTLVAGTQTGERSWTLVNSEYDTEQEVYASDYVCESTDAKVVLKTRLRAVSAESCLVTYWFVIEKQPLWLPPFAKAIRRADTTVWKALK